MPTTDPTPDDLHEQVSAYTATPEMRAAAADLLARSGALDAWRDAITAAADTLAERTGLPADLLAVAVAAEAVTGAKLVRDGIAGTAEARGRSVSLVGSAVLPGRSASNTRRALPASRGMADQQRAADLTGRAVTITYGTHWPITLRPPKRTRRASK